MRKKNGISEQKPYGDTNDYRLQEGFLGAGSGAEILELVVQSMENGLSLDKWIGLYATASKLSENQNYKGKKRKALEDGRKKHAITYEDIKVHPGVPWVRREIIQQFVWHLVYDTDDIRQLGDPNQRNAKYSLFTVSYYIRNEERKRYARFEVSYEDITGYWTIETRCYNDLLKRAAAHANLCESVSWNILNVLELMLNLRNNGETSEKERILLEEAKKNIQKEFDDWLWKDEDRKWEVEEAYNLMFAEIESPEERERIIKYQELKIQQARNGERDCAVTLYPYQESAVERIVSQDNTLLALDVGAGKTYIMIAAAMRMRRLGISRKNLFVVPNNITAQWAVIFETMYPKARILIIDPQNFTKEHRERTLLLAKDGDFDGIIIAYSCFEQIHLSEEFLGRMQEEQRSAYWKGEGKYDDAFGHDGKLSRNIRSRIQSQGRLFSELTLSYLSCDNTVTFDSLEIETIFVDEAHNYKNLPLTEKSLNYIKGLNTKGSLKCFDMLCKIRSVQQHNKGRGAVFATGTPLTNSIADTYVMQIYLQSELMKKNHLDQFSNWLKTFGSIEERTEIDVNARTFRSVQRLGRFINLPELSRMFAKIAVFYTLKNKKLPDFSGYSEKTLPIDDDLNRYMKKISTRSEIIRSGDISPHKDNMLKVSSDGRKAALDLRLVGEKQILEYGKIFVCARKTLEIYNEYPGTAQLIFCDLGTPQGGCKKLNVYKQLKEMLVSGGIKAREIAFIHQISKEHEKAELYEKVNNAEIRILIGSTFKLGIGANVQRKLKAIHHLDAPWRPADMVQRDGRILRQGNENSEVEIYRYIREGSFDAYTWQVLENKQRFISQFLKGTTKQRIMKDLDDAVLSYAEVKALAHGDSRLRDLAHLENELASCQLLYDEFVNKTVCQKKRIPYLKEQLAEHEACRHQILQDIEIIKKTSPDDFKELRKKLKSVLETTAIPAFADSEKSLLCWKEFKFFLRNGKNDSDADRELNNPLLIIKGHGRYEVTLGASAVGNTQRAVNYLNNLDKKAEAEGKEFLLREQELKQALEMNEDNNPYSERLRSLEKETNTLRSEIFNP